MDYSPTHGILAPIHEFDYTVIYTTLTKTNENKRKLSRRFTSTPVDFTNQSPIQITKFSQSQIILKTIKHDLKKTHCNN